MTILFICHETGRTGTLMSIAREIKGEEIIFLSVGIAAKKLLSSLEANDPLKRKAKIVHLSAFFEEAAAQHFEKNPLSPEQLELLRTKFLNTLGSPKIVIGAPSWHRAMAPFQIAEMMAERVTPATAFIVDGDYYKEQGCAYWTVLEKPMQPDGDWRNHFTWLAPLQVAADEIRNVNPHINNIAIIGDPSLDAALQIPSLSSRDHEQARVECERLRNEDLRVKADQALLYMSGTKVIAEDVAMMKKILAHHPTSNTQIRVILHPGCLEPNQYLAAMLALLDETNNIEANIQFIVSEDVLNNVLNAELRANASIYSTSVNRDKLVSMADGVACAIPGTQATQSAIKGIPTYYDLTHHKSYLPQTRILTGELGLAEFMSFASNRLRMPRITRQELGLPTKSAAKMVADMVSPQKTPWLTYGIFATAIVSSAYMVYKQFNDAQLDDQSFKMKL